MATTAPTTTAAAAPPAAARRPRLDAPAGARILAALHIYLFHLDQLHDAKLATFPIFDRLSGPVENLLARGYQATGFFFALSGFLLAYAYLDASGRLRVSDGAFWRGRFLRLYPLYFVSLLLLVPAPALLPIGPEKPPPGDVLFGAVTTLTLTQTWFPRFALGWNAPAWALSAFAAFYIAFPAFARATSRLTPAGLVRLLMALVGLALVPGALYLRVDPAGDAWTVTEHSFPTPWLSALRYNPLVWMPQFLAGAVLGRLFAGAVDRGEVVPASGDRRGPSRGDLAAAAILGVLAFAPQRLVPYALLRHGLLLGPMLVVVLDLARGRGWLARLLAWPALGRWSEASVALFALQMPVGLWYGVAVNAAKAPWRGTTVDVFVLIAVTLAASWGWAWLIQPRLSGRAGRRASATAAA